MAKKIAEKKMIIRITLVLLSILLISAGLKIYEEVFSPNVSISKRITYLYVYSKLPFDENFERIEKQQVLKHPTSLKRILTLTGYNELLKPGRYRLTNQMNNLELLRMLVSGRQESYDVVLKYAERIHDLSSFFGTQLEADSNKLESMLTGSLPMDSLGLDANNAVLLFIPNTYNFYWNTSAEKLISKMIKEHRLFWDSTKMQKANALGLTKQQVGTLASIVQKETNKTDEMTLVAGVYYNRMIRGMLLQADPTILFAINDKSIRRVGGEMLKIASPYNTYLNKGLPPGPICMPSVQAINAVLNMTRHKYIYFCAKEDFSGYHNFAASFDQHQVNARKYQRALNAKGIK